LDELLSVYSAWLCLSAFSGGSLTCAVVHVAAILGMRISEKFG